MSKLPAMNDWIFAVLVALAPPDRYAPLQALPGWSETPAEREARYRTIAADLDAVIAAAPPLFGGAGGKRETAALILAVAHHESGFAPDVDLGPCYRGRDGRSLRCDAGRAACVMQVRGTPEEQRELFADRRRCFREGLRLLRRSLSACSKLPPSKRLAAYASGSCAGGHKESADMIAAAQRALIVKAKAP
jgi:hypothetical protein